LLGPGPRLMKKRIYRAAVSQSLRNTGLVSGKDCGVKLRRVGLEDLPPARRSCEQREHFVLFVCLFFFARRIVI